MPRLHPLPATPALELRGAVVAPGDAAYDELRRLHNAMIDRRPALIAQVADEADVAAALRYAQETGLPLSVRGGGHAAAGHAIAEGGVVIDMRALKRVVVDPAARTVRAGAGLNWGELDAATQAHGLAVTGGRVSDTGIVGFTLGSGSGWLERVMGLAPDNLRSARLVTADGRAITASASEHPELFWALRGGGGNFGVVTELEFDLMPLGPSVLGGLRAYPYERAAEVLHAYAEVMARAPDELCGGLALTSAPHAPHIPEALRGRPVVGLVALWAGDSAGAAAGLAPLTALGEPVLDLVGAMPYTGIQRLFETGPSASALLRSYYKFGFLDELPEAAVDMFVELAGEIGPTSSVLLQPLGGAYARGREADGALGRRDAAWAYQLLTRWDAAEADAANIAWTRAAAAELADFGRPGSFPNFVSDDCRNKLALAYDEATLRRLRDVKAAWDPANVFRSNHNIPPASAEGLRPAA